MSRERKSLVIRLSVIAAAVLSLGGALVMLSRAAEAVRWGDRITDVEAAAKALAAGQVAMGNEIANIKADVARASDRSDKGFQSVMTELAKMNGALAGLVEQSVKTQEQLAAVKEKAANALVQTDAMREKIDEVKESVVAHMLKQAEGKK